MWAREPETDLWEALSAAPCEAPSEVEVQGEALGFDATGRGYIIVSEGQNPPLHYFPLP